MAYDCNTACVQLEKSVTHGLNARLGHHVTHLEGNMDDILVKLEQINNWYADVAKMLQELKENGPPTSHQVELEPIGLAVNIQDGVLDATADIANIQSISNI
ncbi:hypothetical protein CVT25_009038 [Psilocybe cyanescens]|uniref:Uncharacterized protein n=1 Tax=Psilocybe cyanescens TaxID=93625 RepID=A0A409X897_PSICY|nr:hypothetical protein CVT25_009038 [Psilocybe cyanescens]